MTNASCMQGNDSCRLGASGWYLKKPQYFLVVQKNDNIYLVLRVKMVLKKSYNHVII